MVAITTCSHSDTELYKIKDRSGTWGSELEMMCLSHMLNTIVFSFVAPNNNQEVFGYNFIDRSLICDYTKKSVYLWFSDSLTSVMAEES